MLLTPPKSKLHCSKQKWRSECSVDNKTNRFHSPMHNLDRVYGSDVIHSEKCSTPVEKVSRTALVLRYCTAESAEVFAAWETVNHAKVHATLFAKTNYIYLFIFQRSVTETLSECAPPNYLQQIVQAKVPSDHLLLDSAFNLGPLKVLKLLFQQFLNLSSSQRDMSGPILGDLSNNRWCR